MQINMKMTFVGMHAGLYFNAILLKIMSNIKVNFKF